MTPQVRSAWKAITQAIEEARSAKDYKSREMGRDQSGPGNRQVPIIVDKA